MSMHIVGGVASFAFGCLTAEAGIKLFGPQATLAGWMVVVIGAAAVHLTAAAIWDAR